MPVGEYLKLLFYYFENIKAMANNTDKKEVCQAARQIQDILARKNLELVIWPNVAQEKCVWVIQKGKNPWEGARIATLKKESIVIM